MATRRVNDPKARPNRRPPATTPEDRENQLVALAVDVAEEMMRSGSPPAQVVTHYLKLGSSREKLEQERMRQEVELLKIKREALASEKRVEEMYAEAMAAFRGYSGQPPESMGDEDYEA